MRFEIKNDKGASHKISLQNDCDDVDIVLTDEDGEDWTIAYLNDNGLTICSGLSGIEGLELEKSGHLKHRTD